MKAEKITVGITGSIKLEQYQYMKPYVGIEFELDENEKPGEVAKIARDRVIKEMSKLERDIIDTWKGTNNPF